MNLGNFMLNPYIKIQLINNPLTFRRKLTIPADTRFGLEIELEIIVPLKSLTIKEDMV